MSAIVNSQNVTFAVGGVNGTPAHFIIYDGSSYITEENYNEIRNASINREPVWIIYGSGASANYYTYIKQDTSGYYFSNVNDDGNVISTLLVRNDRSVVNTRNNISKPITYWTTSTWWNTRISLTNQFSGTTLVTSPYSSSDTIYLYAGKRYLVTANCYGSIEWTTTSNVDSEKRFQLYLVMTDSNFTTTYGNCLRLGEAQFYFNRNKGSLSSGYHFIQSIHPVTTVITPTNNLVLNKFVWMNDGNVVGSSTSAPAYVYADYEIGYVIVQEI